MKLHELTYADGAKTKRKRVGRGPGSGLGKTSGKDIKVKKLGRVVVYTSVLKVARCRCNVAYRSVDLQIFLRQTTRSSTLKLEQRFESGTEITLDLLRETRLARKATSLVKILGEGDLTKSFHIHAHAFSKSAMEKIKAVGGECTVVN
jgi:large subunit ribosomal protein L15